MNYITLTTTVGSDPAPTFRQLNRQSSNVRIGAGRIGISWPKASQTIYPKQSIRVNTGWQTSVLGQNSSLTTFPHSSLVANNIQSTPVFYDATQIGQQLVQTVSNNNDFPIRVEFIGDDGQDRFSLLRLNNEGLMVEQVLQFDFGQFLQGVVGVATTVLPLVAML